MFVERWAQSCHTSAPNCTHTQCSSLYRPRHILCGLSWEYTMRTTRSIYSQYFEYRCLEIAVYSQKHSAQAASGSMVCPETVAVTVCSALANVLARVPLGANNPTTESQCRDPDPRVLTPDLPVSCVRLTFSIGQSVVHGMCVAHRGPSWLEPRVHRSPHHDTNSNGSRIEANVGPLRRGCGSVLPRGSLE